MSPLHRTQVQLDRAQYEELKRLAAEQGISLSELLRRIVDRELGAKDRQDRDALRRVRGLVADAGVAGRDHDAVLYGGGEDAGRDRDDPEDGRDGEAA